MTISVFAAIEILRNALMQERLLFDLARKKGFVEVAGSSWRRERSDSPLVNTYRNWCDARGICAIFLHKVPPIEATQGFSQTHSRELNACTVRHVCVSLELICVLLPLPLTSLFLPLCSNAYCIAAFFSLSTLPDFLM